MGPFSSPDGAQLARRSRPVPCRGPPRLARRSRGPEAISTNAGYRDGQPSRSSPDARVRDASRSSSIASGFTSAPFLPTPFHAKVVTDPREMSTPVHSAKPAQHYPSYTFPPSPPSSAESSPIDSSPLAKRASDVVASNKPALVSRASSESLGSPRAFIRDVFPDAHATILGAVDVEARDAPHWQLAMVGRTLYARMPSADAERAADLRDTVVAVLERADELGSDAVVVVLDKDDQELGSTIHQLMFVGGAIISPAKSTHDNSRYVLIGLDV